MKNPVVEILDFYTSLKDAGTEGTLETKDRERRIACWQRLGGDLDDAMGVIGC